jgi:glycosyltransferase involved in cell wall biosynthesis
VIIGSGVSREIFEALVYAIATKNEALLDTLIEKGYDLDPVELSGPWSDVKSFLSDHAHKSELFAQGADLLEHVHFLGRLDHAFLRYVFPCADVGFFPSIVPEAYASVLFESLSNGVFPMASYFSGLACGLDELVPFLGPELVDLMKIPVDDTTRIPALIKNLSRVLADNVPQRTRSDLRRIAVENFDWEIRARQMVSAYAKCISKG